MIEMKYAHKRGICPLCEKEYLKGRLCYYDRAKEDKHRYVHWLCYHKVLWERDPDKAACPF